jgi:nucleoid-associated protein YgaU
MSRYDTIRRVNKNKVVRVGTSYLPTVEDKNSDILLIATQGDRCDLISHQYYGSPEYWWFIASVNNLKSNNIEAGTQLRIPISIEEASLK